MLGTNPVSAKLVALAAVVLTVVKLVPSVERSTKNPVSLLELSVQFTVIPDATTFVKDMLVGASGCGSGVNVKTVLEPSAEEFKPVTAALFVNEFETAVPVFDSAGPVRLMYFEAVALAVPFDIKMDLLTADTLALLNTVP